MISIILVAIVGGGLVSRSFVLFKRIGHPDYAGQEKKLLQQAIGGILVAFVFVMIIAMVLKFGGFEQ